MFSRWTFERRTRTYTKGFPPHKYNYPLWVINKVIDDAEKNVSANENDSSNNEKNHRLMLPYEGDKGSSLLKSMKRYVDKLLPEYMKLEITLQVKKLIHILQ